MIQKRSWEKEFLATHIEAAEQQRHIPAKVEHFSKEGGWNVACDTSRTLGFVAEAAQFALGLSKIGQRIELSSYHTGVHPDLLNSRFGYVSISRASHEATLFTNDMAKLSPQLSADVSKTSALEIGQSASLAQEIAMT
jgi:hypothetical protein